MEKESYLESKEYYNQIMNFAFEDGEKKPILSGYGRILSDLKTTSDIELFLLYIVVGLFQLEHNALMEDVEVQMTGWIKAYKEGWFDGMIEDVELLEADIAKIESMITLKFDEVELVED